MMDKFPPSISRLIKELQQVPYLASKNLYRVASYFLEQDAQKVKQFASTLLEAHELLEQCVVCCVWKEKTLSCQVCSDPRRTRSLICVVETWQDFIALEKAGGYQGLYHVLGGSICPLEGIGPEDLSIDRFIMRINDEIKEVILALNQTPEGEATSAYIAHKLKGHSIVITCLARGVPVGSTLEAMDRLTVYKAIAERRHY